MRVCSILSLPFGVIPGFCFVVGTTTTVCWSRLLNFQVIAGMNATFIIINGQRFLLYPPLSYTLWVREEYNMITIQLMTAEYTQAE
jgi:hypothetical protein